MVTIFRRHFFFAKRIYVIKGVVLLVFDVTFSTSCKLYLDTQTLRGMKTLDSSIKLASEIPAHVSGVRLVVQKSTKLTTRSLMTGAVVCMIIRSLDLQLSMQTVLITTNVVSSNPADGEVYSIQHYVIKFVSVLNRERTEQLYGFQPCTKIHVYNQNNTIETIIKILLYLTEHRIELHTQTHKVQG